MTLSRWVSKAKCRIDRIWLAGLSRLFGFDPWHASAPYSCRPYKKQVVDLVNSLQPVLVVEVGCGLGDILSRIKAQWRLGLDSDASVIKAAQFLHPGNIHWLQGEATSVLRVLPTGRRMDCLVMVNWIHNLSPEGLAALLLPLLPRTSFIVLDSIDTDAPSSYRHRHDFGFLSGLAERTSVTRVPGEPRTFNLFKVVT